MGPVEPEQDSQGAHRVEHDAGRYEPGFGTKKQVDLIQHLVSAATTRDDNPRKDAIYLSFTPPKNVAAQ
jgi:hypothetical protein